ncbi:MAG: 7,8-didemethyl-8-hydroxy-5-deazariboflavin synthase subunit CofG [Prochlorotrichaceae cyanobacterium]
MSTTPWVTYSPAYTLVPTYECFNHCSYCNFRVPPGEDAWMSEAEAIRHLDRLKGSGVIEILVLSGEVHPQSPRRSLWFQRIYRLCELALERGFLPHTNAGPLLRAEMEQLRQVNVSMGLMLEDLSEQIQQTVHRHAPSKDPKLRLQQLDWAGELQIPFTTGLLLGLGETPADRLYTLETIARLHDRWGHIQEVILQPYRPGSSQSGSAPGLELDELPAIVAQARQILPAEITLQIPPNLVGLNDRLLRCLEAGARDLGGLVPVDEVNPDYEHASLGDLQDFLAQAGWQLRPRLPVYPPFYPLLARLSAQK